MFHLPPLLKTLADQLRQLIFSCTGGRRLVVGRSEDNDTGFKMFNPDILVVLCILRAARIRLFPSSMIKSEELSSARGGFSFQSHSCPSCQTKAVGDRCPWKRIYNLTNCYPISVVVVVVWQQCRSVRSQWCVVRSSSCNREVPLP